MINWFLIALCSLSHIIQYNGKPTPPTIMEIYAHRAGRGLAPENTLSGCDACSEVGVDYIDFDIGITKDGVLVVTHDTTLNPDITRDENGEFITEALPIHALSFEELQKYDVGKIDPESEYATYFPDQIESEEAKIPSLKEAIEYLKGQDVGFQIEIKTKAEETPPPEVFAKALNQLLLETGVIAYTEVQAIDFRCLKALQKLNPEIRTSYVSKGKFSPEVICSHGGNCWSLYEMDATESKIKKAQQMGIKVVAWGFPEEEGTEFNQTQIIKLIKWGIDGIITDRPDKLKQLLENMYENAY